MDLSKQTYLSDYVSEMKDQMRLVISFGSVLVVGIFDFLVGADISTALFYFMPIALASYRQSLIPGIIICVLSALAWGVSDFTTSQSQLVNSVLLWNTFMRLVMFLFIAILIHNLWLRGNYFQKLSNYDELTSVLNRRGFLAKLQEELQRAKRFKRSFSIAFIDLDNFKSVNDTLGHKVGDELLRLVSNVLLSNIRSVDSTGRMGGDEFAVLYIETSTNAVKEAFSKCHQELLETMRERGWPVTFSVGVVTFNEFEQGVLEIVELADKWMYSVKSDGKNRVVYKTDTDWVNKVEELK